MGWGIKWRAAGWGCYRDFLSHCHYFLSRYYCCSPLSPPASRPQSTLPSPSCPSLGPWGSGNGREGPRGRTGVRRGPWWSTERTEARRPGEASRTYEWCPGNWPEEGVSARRCGWSPRWLFEANKYKKYIVITALMNECMYRKILTDAWMNYLFQRYNSHQLASIGYIGMTQPQ